MPINRDKVPPPPPPRHQTKPPAPKVTAAKVRQQDEDQRQSRVDGLNSIASAIQLGLIAARLPADAGAVNRHAPAISTAVAEYAEGNDKAAEFLDRLSDVSPLAGVAMAVAPLLLQVCANHNLFGIKAESFATQGVVSPDTLVAETNTYLLQVQTKAMYDQRVAAQEMMQEREQYLAWQAEMDSAQADEAPNDDNAGT